MPCHVPYFRPGHFARMQFAVSRDGLDTKIHITIQKSSQLSSGKKFNHARSPQSSAAAASRAPRYRRRVRSRRHARRRRSRDDAGCRPPPARGGHMCHMRGNERPIGLPKRLVCLSKNPVCLACKIPSSRWVVGEGDGGSSRGGGGGEGQPEDRGKTLTTPP